MKRVWGLGAGDWRSRFGVWGLEAPGSEFHGADSSAPNPLSFGRHVSSRDSVDPDAELGKQGPLGNGATASLRPAPSLQSPIPSPRHPAPGPRPPAADVAAAYRTCREIAATHYENFTVGSWLLPRRLRLPLAAIYAFARTADDIADEGTATAGERLERLAGWERDLEACFRGEARDPIFIALAHTAASFDLPIQPFRDLLQAFRADALFQPFPNAEAMLSYCRCSANPVGRLVLALFGHRDPHRTALADDICTGLQLANFCQDIAVDAARGRCYVPLDELAAFEATPEMLGGGVATPALRALVALQIERADRLLNNGIALAQTLERRLAREVFLFASGGLAILRRIVAVDHDVFTRRPTLSRLDKFGLVFRALWLPRPGRRISRAASAAVRS